MWNVFQVRKHTQLSHEMSRVAVAVVVGSLCDLLPPSVSPQLNAMLMHLQGPLAAPQPFIEETHDARRLRVIFTELTSCKEDSQQRSWMLYEDETTIIEYIQELISILVSCRTNIIEFLHVHTSDDSAWEESSSEIRRSAVHNCQWICWFWHYCGLCGP